MWRNQLSLGALHLPKMLLLVRHGESSANVDPVVYSHTADWRIPLTAKGHAEGLECGKRLRSIICNDDVYFYRSPYVRARQTLDAIITSFDPSQVIGCQEDERLREQDMGNYQPVETMKQIWVERSEQSRFYYRFPNGENGADVSDRVSSFLDSLFRESSLLQRASSNTVVLVAHGLWIRLFLALWYRLPLEVFDIMYNPPNCAVLQMDRDDATGQLVLSSQSATLMGIKDIKHLRIDVADNTEWYARSILEGHCCWEKNSS